MKPLQKPWAAWLHIQDWAGHTKQAVFVVDETEKSYRITPAGHEQIKIGGRSRWLTMGKTALVPKHAVSARADTEDDAPSNMLVRAGYLFGLATRLPEEDREMVRKAARSLVYASKALREKDRDG